jgi:predicted transglutaminase-like cysteine proteinase
MRIALVSALLVLFFPACAATAIELGRSSNGQKDEPFGTIGFVAPEGLTWDEWRKIKAAIEVEMPKLALCQADLDNCTSAQRRFATIVKEAKGQQGLARIEVVNKRINAAIRYKSDKVQWGVADVWSTPTNKNGSFDTGFGDCEDYAIAKYVALRQTGFPASNMRMVLVRDNSIDADHAVLAVRYDKRWLILDNRWDKLIEDKALTQFKPLVVVDANGVTLLGKPFTLHDRMAAAAAPCAATSIH